MLSMLRGHYLTVLETTTSEEFQRQVIRFANSMGFDIASAMTVVDHSKTHTEFHVVDNMPLAYSDGFDNAELQQSDPVMQHCKHSSIPIIWDQSTYIDSNRAHLWEEQAAHGLKTGIAVAIHLPEDRHFFIGVDRPKPLSSRIKRLSVIVAELQLFAVHAQDAALRIFCPPPTGADGTQLLTPREAEALRWTMEGKSAFEVSEALNISERTTVFHLRNAMKKLACKSKHQAVLKAMRLGLLA